MWRWVSWGEVLIAVGDERRERVDMVRVLHDRHFVRLQGKRGECQAETHRAVPIAAKGPPPHPGVKTQISGTSQTPILSSTGRFSQSHWLLLGNGRDLLPRALQRDLQEVGMLGDWPGTSQVTRNRAGLKSHPLASLTAHGSPLLLAPESQRGIPQSFRDLPTRPGWWL